MKLYRIKITADENSISIRCKEQSWYLEAINATEKELPYVSTEAKVLKMKSRNYDGTYFFYELNLIKGYF